MVHAHSGAAATGEESGGEPALPSEMANSRGGKEAPPEFHGSLAAALAVRLTVAGANRVKGS